MDLRDRLLAVMDRKDHWAWPLFASGQIERERLLVHFQQEYAVYVRDFPVLLGRVLGQGPPEPVRRALASNLYEEQTGGLSRGVPHPELFLRMMEGLGFPRAAFDAPALLPASRAYRDFLLRATARPPWQVGAAVATIFVEGSVQERSALERRSPPVPEDPEEAIRLHPLVRHRGVDPKYMDLVRVHREVEGGHRKDAWDSVLGHTPASLERSLVSAMRRALRLWLAYRDAIVAEMGVRRDAAA
jgi:pyrroloquinoline quinone (PQQ) biosynthesis protein C